MTARKQAFAVGDRVAIVAAHHPHRGSSGRIVAPATRGPASVGLDWEVELDEWTGGCFVANDEIRPDRRGRP